MNDTAIRILSAKAGETHLFFIGQAGYVIKSRNGQLMGFDLCLSECVERIEGHIGFKRLIPKILDPFELRFDCLVATHPHFDHFDMDAIPQMMSNHHTKLFASVNCETEVKRLMMTGENTSYVKPGDSVDCGDFHIDFVECDHGKGAPDAVGAVIAVDGKKIYMAGDTCLRMDRVDDIKKIGQLDVVIGPINGAFGNMNEEEFAGFAHALGSKLTIPCHFGMFATHGGNPGRFLEIMKNEYPDDKALLMSLGEGIIL